MERRLERETSGWGFDSGTNLLWKDKSEKMAWGRMCLEVGWSPGPSVSHSGMRQWDYALTVRMEK